MSSAESDDDIPVAATAVLVRDGARGPEMLMFRRPDRGSFAGAWVFPGGKLDPQDREQAGSDAGELAAARIAAARETHEEVGLVIDPSLLTTVSCWVPPAATPLRIRTWFFALPAPEGIVVPNLGEVEEYAWVRPGDALDRHGRGEMHLYPPTWITLYGMSDQPDAAAVLAEIRLSGIQRFETLPHPRKTRVMTWTGDEEYGDGAPGARHRITMDALPWIYARGR